MIESTAQLHRHSVPIRPALRAGAGPATGFTVSTTQTRRKTHYAASLMSAADQQIPDDTRVTLEELITETGR